MEIANVNYCMDRILRVTVLGNMKHVIEYCPMDSSDLCAHIDATVKYTPSIANKNTKEGLSAKVRIYNPSPELLQTINQHSNWMIGAGTQSNFYRKRCKVLIDAGYWDSDFGSLKISESDSAAIKREKQDRIDKKGRNYKNIFEGWLNTSAYYRKGADNILELFCHDIRLTDREISTITSAALLSDTNYQRSIYESAQEDKGKQIIGRTDISFQSMLLKVIRESETQKTPSTPWPWVTRTENMSTSDTWVTNEDRTTGWQKTWKVSLQFIKPPRDVENPGDGAQPDGWLMQVVQNYAADNGTPLNTKGLVVNAPYFEDRVWQVCNYFWPTPMRWKADYSQNDGLTRYYFWVPESWGQSKSETEGSSNWSRHTTVITNFQNLLEVPSIDGAGCFTIKMMFNKDVRAGGLIMLTWDENKYTSDSRLAPYTKGVMSTASGGQYWPSLQGGRYNAQVYALQYKKMQEGLIAAATGDVFNQEFFVSYLTHKLSTHSNTWYTEVKTAAAMMNVQYKRKE